jgi:hypothetical protein
MSFHHHEANKYTLHDTLITSINTAYHYLYHVLYIPNCAYTVVLVIGNKTLYKTPVKHCSHS